MWDVVEHQARDGERLEIIEAGGGRQAREFGVGRVERERDEGEETTGQVLLLTKAD